MSKTITLHESATETIRRMNERVMVIGNVFGPTSAEYTTAAQSLAHALTQVMLSGFGDASVTRDGDLSLFVQEGGFQYGVIFHPDRGAAERKLKAHDLDPAEHAEILAHYDGIAGSWSLHS